MKKLLLIDAKNMLYRAHFAFKNLATMDGRPTGALHGFIHQFLDARNYLGKSAVVVVWDNAVPFRDSERLDLWRRELAPFYKANRKLTKDHKDALSQVKPISRVLRLMGVAQIGVPGLEADDLMGILAGRIGGPSKYEACYIYSNDQDMFQCLRPGVKILRRSKSAWSLMNHKEFRREFRIAPSSWPSVKALMGDKTDNFKPIPGVGLVKAIRYVQGGVRPKVSAWSKLPSHVRHEFPELAPHWHLVHLCYRLAKIPTDPKHFEYNMAARIRIKEAIEKVEKSGFQKVPGGSLEAAYQNLIDYLERFQLSQLALRKYEFYQHAK